MRWINPAAIIALLCLAPAAFAATAQDYDLIKMKNGALLEGCVVLDSNESVVLENASGKFTVPRSQIETVVNSRRGESEFMLGRQLFQRQQFERARVYLQRAARYAEWRDQARDLSDRLEQELERRRDQDRHKQAQEIEQLIQKKGVKKALEELKRRDRNKDDSEFWGGMRGKLHLTMAQERMDHLDLRSAERHLVLAANYGVDADEWETVRKKLVDLRTYRLRYGEDALEKFRPKPKPLPLKRTQFFAAVQRAQRQGESLPPLEWLEWIDSYSRQHNLDPLMVWAVIDVESSWRPAVVSHKGAQGLMQLMPGTAEEVDVSDPFDPHENIKGGTRYLRFLLDIFNDEDKALAAYNTGPGRVERSGITSAGARYVDKVRDRLETLENRFSRWARG